MGKSIGPVRRSFAPWLDPDAKPLVEFRGIVKRFGETVAVDHLDLGIYEREFFALLGPSGCGKTTLLRMLAGFENPDEGTVSIDGKSLAGVPPYRRPVNTVFQSYALFPHMTVEANIAFGLKQDRLPKDEIDRRVEEALTLVKLTGMGKRKPDQLSGGQRQRVALARSLAKHPKVLLLDEPLAALDKKLREETQFELADLQQRLGLTFVIVTHDQEEAMTLADRIAVMSKGRIVQVASPAEIYEQPNSRYVADFVGDINILECGLAGRNEGLTRLECPGAGAVILLSQEIAADPGTKVFFAVRPEKMQISLAGPAEPGVNSLYGEVWDIGYLGDVSVYHVRLADGQTVKATVANRTRLVERPITWEDKVWLSWSPDAGIVLTK
ncbi:MAG: ABC transporter ATP-binding protein [Bauldia sp.]|nr:ABC transporter ATP-binding protein [Bauldia sp.]